MSANNSSGINHFSDNEIKESYHWKSLYKVSGAAALTAVLVMLIEMFLTLIPGGERVDPASMTVIDWFTLFQDNWFIALRNLGLLNIIAVTLGIPVFLALFAAHRRTNKAYAALAMIISFIGVAVFFGTNRAFPMLDLSNQYAVATSDAQRAMLAAAGQAMLSTGQSHTPGTFLGFFLADIAGIIISIVMLRGKVFGRVNACIGIIAFIFFLVFEICSSFVPAAFYLAMVFAMIGGILSLVWYVLIARRLFQLSRASTIYG
jgi:hypothetical protein